MHSQCSVACLNQFMSYSYMNLFVSFCVMWILVIIIIVIFFVLYSPEFARYCQWKHIELNIPYSVRNYFALSNAYL